MGLQLKEMQAQLQQAKDQYDSLNGLRDVGGLLKDDLLTQYLPRDFQSAFDAIRTSESGEFSGISGSLEQITSQYQDKSCDDLYTGQTGRQRCNEEWRGAALQREVGDMGYQAAAQRIDNLETFMNSITESSDPKSVLDLQARIAIEQVRVQNEMIKLNTVAMLKSANENLELRKSVDSLRANMMAPKIVY